MLRRGGLAYRDLERAGVFLVVVRCDARFQSPARYDDVLVLTTAVAGVGAARAGATSRPPAASSAGRC